MAENRPPFLGGVRIGCHWLLSRSEGRVGTGGRVGGAN
jgi:hypothetical protein